MTAIATASNSKSNITKIKPAKVARPPKYMNTIMKDKFRDILIGMRNEAIAAQPTEQIEYEKIADDSDVASKQEAIVMDLRQRERNNFLVIKINKSLNQIASGDYGYCGTCDDEIGEARLLARPTAELCISCKSAAEQHEGQFTKKRAA